MRSEGIVQMLWEEVAFTTQINATAGPTRWFSQALLSGIPMSMQLFSRTVSRRPAAHVQLDAAALVGIDVAQPRVIHYLGRV